MRGLLVSLKSRLCEIASKEMDFYDSSELEYLMNTIDGFLMGYLEVTKENIEDFIESVVSVAIMQVKFDLLDYVKPFSREDIWQNIITQ